MIQLHLDAILDRLRAHPDLAAIVHDEEVTEASGNYVVVYTNTGRDTGYRFSGPSMVTEYTYTVHSVGASRRSAIWVAERVRAQLVNWIPTVPGRQCGRLQHPVSRPIAVDRDGERPLWFAVDQFDLTSSPA